MKILVAAVLCVIALGVVGWWTYGSQAPPESPSKVRGETETQDPANENLAAPEYPTERRETVGSAEPGPPKAVEEVSEEVRMARLHLMALDSSKDRVLSASVRSKPRRIRALLSESLAVVQYEFGQYQKHGPMYQRDPNGVPLQFVINGVGYYFAVGTYPEFDEIKALLRDGETLERTGVPKELEEITLARYAEARAYLLDRAELASQ